MNTNQVFHVKVNGYEFSIDQASIDQLDLVEQASESFHLIHEFASVSVRVVETTPTSKQTRIEVDGAVFDVDIKDPLDQMLDNMGFGKSSTKHVKDIKAPMPGLVLEVNVQEGQEVKAGDKLLILGAMKMENSIVIPTDGVIKSIRVKAGDAVEKGQLLIDLV